MTLTVGSLFSGIGGLDLGLERAGMKVIWNCEIDPYACRVLKKHWPDVPNIGNIKEVNWNDITRPDVLCGGYPCQPFSQAGQRKGEEDPRHLFPWVAEAIRHLRPRYAIMENVSGHLSMGFGTVQGLLAEIGYDSRWDCVPAAAVRAPHLRDRVFIIATPRTEQSRTVANSDDRGSRDPLFARWDAPGHGSETMAHSDIPRSQGWPNTESKKREDSDGHTRPSGTPVSDSDSNSEHGRTTFASEMAVAVSNTCHDEVGCGQENLREVETSVDGWPTDRGRVPQYDGREWWPPEPNVGRVAHGIPSRMDRLRGLGNAVAPQVAEYIGRIVIAHDLRT